MQNRQLYAPDVGTLIVCAAMRYNNIVICGARHFDMIMHRQIAAMLPEYQDLQGLWEQGFITNKSDFLDRKQA